MRERSSYCTMRLLKDKKISSINVIIRPPHPNRASANPDARFVVINNQHSFHSNHHHRLRQPPSLPPIAAIRHHCRQLLSPPPAHHRPLTTPTAHTDDDSGNVATPRHQPQPEPMPKVVQTTWQMCHIVQMVTTHAVVTVDIR